MKSKYETNIFLQNKVVQKSIDVMLILMLMLRLENSITNEKAISILLFFFIFAINIL